MTPDEILTTQQVADEIGRSCDTVRRAIKRGELRAVKRGGRIYVRRSAVEAFLTPDAHASVA